MKSYDRIYIEISNRCNLNCSFCPTLDREEREMTLSEFERIIKQCAPMAGQVFLHLMGEPLLHPELEAILELCHEEKAPVQITTNGTILNHKTVSLLSHPTVRQVNFSLQCLADNDLHEETEKLLLPILEACRAIHKRNDAVFINLRLWNSDQKRNEKELDIIENFFDTSFNRKVETGAIKSKKIGDHLYLHFDTRFDWPELSNPFRGERGRCHALDSQVAILSNGEVVPCCLDKDGRMSLGNCLEQPLSEILASKRAVSIKEGFIRGDLVEKLCQHCSYSTRFSKRGDK